MVTSEEAMKLLVDEVPPWTMVHHIRPWNVCRGMIYNTETKAKTCETLRINCQIIQTPDTLEAYLGDLGHVSLTSGMEASMVYVWANVETKTVMVSTNKRIFASQSYWGNLTFLDMYISLGGCMDYAMLFESDPKRIYYYLIVHPALQAVISYDSGPGHVVLLGYTTTDEPKALRYPFLDDQAVKLLSVAEAKEALQQDFVIATFWTGAPYQSEVVSIQPIHSPAYAFRRGLPYAFDANLWHRIVMLSNAGSMDKTEYARIFPWISNLLIADLKGVYTRPHTEHILPTTLEKAGVMDMQRNVWQVMLASISPNLRETFSHLVHRFYIMRANLVAWLATTPPNYIQSNHHLNPQMASLFVQLVLDAQFQTGPNKPLVKIIRKQLCYEKPGTLFRMLSAVAPIIGMT